MICMHTVAALLDELEKIGNVGLIAPALLGRGASAGIRASAKKMVGRLPSPASVVKPNRLASKVRIAADTPSRIISGGQPRMISRRATRPTMAMPAVGAVQQAPALRAVA